MKAIRRFSVRTTLPEPIAGLRDLAVNLRWSWHAPTRDLFAAVDPLAWIAVGQDPIRLLSEVSADRLGELAADEGFVAWVHEQRAELEAYLTEPRWYSEFGSDAPSGIAYFSPEYGVTAALPQYSGGLGILAGDHLKTASDLGVPLIGIGLFYLTGYFRQSLDRDGWQVERYPVCDPDASPVALLRDAEGVPVRVTLALPGPRELHARVWVAQVGRVPLLLLDTHTEGNSSADREITDRLYGGDLEHRLLQELLLGVGGVRALRAYCRLTGTPEPEVYHMNEGHAGFLGIERVRELVDATDGSVSFGEALDVTRASTVFTTHTPVPAGIDRFPRELVDRHFARLDEWSRLPLAEILDLGRESMPGGDPDVFNMAIMGLRLAQRANGVSLLHGSVSRSMFAGLWPGFDESDVPIISITNGVHAATWVCRPIQEAAAEVAGPGSLDDPQTWQALARLPDDRLWWIKRQLRAELVQMVRRRVRASWRQRGAAEAELGWIDDVLDPDVLTIGFARRVPSYKRLTLMLRDVDRLRDLLTDPHRPVQLVVAGKSHPADDGGKRLIQQLVQFADERDVRHRIVFLPDYDMAMAVDLYPGCDVWLNNPIRPLEASGTSGMKAALNGALNLSILDGWWDEWFDRNNGWAIPSAAGVVDAERRDDLEAQGLYGLIADEVVPAFYDRVDGIPQRWIAMMRSTLGDLGPKVLASRMVREYVSELYRPAAQASRALSLNDFALARDLHAWKITVESCWPAVRVEHVEADGVGDDVELGAVITIRAYVSLGGLNPHDVIVQAVRGRVDADDRLLDPTTVAMSPVRQYAAERWIYESLVVLDERGPLGYTVRILPTHPGLASTAELGLQSLP